MVSSRPGRGQPPRSRAAAPRLLLAALAAECPASLATRCDFSYTATSEVFRHPEQAKAWLDAGNVTVLDARGQFGGHITGAVHAPWWSFTVSSFRTPTGGLLKEPQQLRAAVGALGVAPTKAVLVYGDWELEWGEEGRLHWMLKYLGHPQVFILAGGLQRYAARYPGDITSAASAAPAADAWDAAAYPPVPRWRATFDQLRSQDPPLFVVDVRTSEEYFGTNTPHGESRPGHVAGATSYPVVDLWSGGCLLSCQEFESKLVSIGWDSRQKLVAYCTAGIRSGFFWSMTLHCGLGDSAAANYDGSMWEWTADASNPMCTSAGNASECKYSASASRRSRSSGALAALASGAAVAITHAWLL